MEEDQKNSPSCVFVASDQNDTSFPYKHNLTSPSSSQRLSFLIDKNLPKSFFENSQLSHKSTTLGDLEKEINFSNFHPSNFPQSVTGFQTSLKTSISYALPLTSKINNAINEFSSRFATSEKETNTTSLQKEFYTLIRNSTETPNET